MVHSTMETLPGDNPSRILHNPDQTTDLSSSKIRDGKLPEIVHTPVIYSGLQ